MSSALNFSRKLVPRDPERATMERPKARVPYNLMVRPLRQEPMRRVKSVREAREQSLLARTSMRAP